MELTCRIEQKIPDWDTLYFHGDIDEDAEVSLARIKEQLSKKCIFNLKEVNSINSCGVRAWINFIREVEQSTEIVFEECTPEIVGQINMIPNFIGESKVNSVYASYVCDDCDIQKLQLFEAGKNLPKSKDQELEEVLCDKCQGQMEMEELEEEFFGWIKE